MLSLENKVTVYMNATVLLSNDGLLSSDSVNSVKFFPKFREHLLTLSVLGVTSVQVNAVRSSKKLIYIYIYVLV